MLSCKSLGLRRESNIKIEYGKTELFQNCTATCKGRLLNIDFTQFIKDRNTIRYK